MTIVDDLSPTRSSKSRARPWSGRSVPWSSLVPGRPWLSPRPRRHSPARATDGRGLLLPGTRSPNGRTRARPPDPEDDHGTDRAERGEDEGGRGYHERLSEQRRERHLSNLRDRRQRDPRLRLSSRRLSPLTPPPVDGLRRNRATVSRSPSFSINKYLPVND